MTNKKGDGAKMDYITVKVENHVAIVTMNKPPMNTLNEQMYEEIRETMQLINKMDNVWVVVLRAEGGNFSAGNDVKDFKKFTTAQKMIKYARVVSNGVNSVYECRVPVIGAVNGLAVGAGFALASCCDIIVAAENAKFCLPEIKVGIVGGACFVSRILPQHLHRYMSYSGDMITAEKMERLGVVMKIVPENELLESSMEIAKRLIEYSPLMMMGLKAAINKNENAQLKGKYILEISYGAELVDTEDYKEAHDAFINKRKAIFKGM